jgi:CRP-like cAMP-binding protein
MGETVAHALVQSMREVPIFSSFDDDGLLQLVGISANLCWAPGKAIFERGSEAEGLYVILTGKVRIEEERDGRLEQVAVLEPGAFFGEVSLLEERNHSRTAVAVDEPAMLMIVPRESFADLLQEHPDMAAALRKTMAERTEPLIPHD